MKAYQKLLQCKDIPEIPILQFLEDNGPDNEYPSGWCFTWWSNGKFNRDLQAAMPPGTPYKIGWKKMSQMKRKGLVDGCDCGCRGDYFLTNKGMEVLNTS